MVISGMEFLSLKKEYREKICDTRFLFVWNSSFQIFSESILQATFCKNTIYIVNQCIFPNELFENFRLSYFPLNTHVCGLKKLIKTGFFIVYNILRWFRSHCHKNSSNIDRLSYKIWTKSKYEISIIWTVMVGEINVHHIYDFEEKS